MPNLLGHGSFPLHFFFLISTLAPIQDKMDFHWNNYFSDAVGGSVAHVKVNYKERSFNFRLVTVGDRPTCLDDNSWSQCLCTLVWMPYKGADVSNGSNVQIHILFIVLAFCLEVWVLLMRWGGKKAETEKARDQVLPAGCLTCLGPGWEASLPAPLSTA